MSSIFECREVMWGEAPNNVPALTVFHLYRRHIYTGRFSRRVLYMLLHRGKDGQYTLCSWSSSSRI